jgi:putative Ca2+/H+ antiporter (TMEM165/GDT1 family)
MDFSIIAVVFGVIFIGELPDKSMFASLALSTRFRKSYVWLGAASAFLVHVVIAVTAGHFLTLLPKQLLDFIVGGLFLLGAVLLLFGKDEDEEHERAAEPTDTAISHSFLKVYATSFIVIFLGEWGDITQIATANYAAKYHNALSVGVGAVSALWLVAALGITLGSKLLKHVPARILQRVTAGILVVFAIISIVAGIKH